MDKPNLFQSLFVFRPREGLTPRENFLTEALAYVIRSDPIALSAWWRCVCPKIPLTKARNFEFVTQHAAVDSQFGEHSIFDLVVNTSIVGREFRCYFEHKWDCAADAKQLRKYRELIRTHPLRSRLVFIGATEEQADIANSSRACDAVLLWRDIHAALARDTKNTTTRELVSFLEKQGLGPVEPITAKQLSSARAARETLERMANELASAPQFRWRWIPQWLRKFDPTSRWGRAAIEFRPKMQWDPCVTIGFLYDVKDHRVKLTDPSGGADVMLRIEASPRRFPNCHPVITELVPKVSSLKKVASCVHIRGETSNGHTLLLVRDSLRNTIGKLKDEQKQLKVIHNRLSKWSQVIFEDGIVAAKMQRVFRSCQNGL
jgi:hypothetical protein